MPLIHFQTKIWKKITAYSPNSTVIYSEQFIKTFIYQSSYFFNSLVCRTSSSIYYPPFWIGYTTQMSIIITSVTRAAKPMNKGSDFIPIYFWYHDNLVIQIELTHKSLTSTHLWAFFVASPQACRNHELSTKFLSTKQELIEFSQREF